MKPKLLPRRPEFRTHGRFEFNRDLGAFTVFELLVVIAAALVLVTLFLPVLARPRCGSSRISCVNSLKQVGTAYRVWAGDNGDRMPFQSADGWANLATNSSNLGPMCWTNYYIMANELGQSPRVLICPTDEREPATSFGTNGAGFGNKNISYFVGLGSDTFPQSFLGGDRNLGPGPRPLNDYGFSPANGRGADVSLSTNSTRNPLVWSLKMHSAKSPQGAGNLLLGDASVQQCSVASLRVGYLPSAGSWPPSGTVSNTCLRLIFP